MQLWFLCFCVWQSSSREVVMKYLFHYFWKPNSPFSKFCVNCLLRFYCVYCDIFVLNDVNWACWCTCLLVALNVPENWFWPEKTRKNWNFLRCIYVFDLVLKNCSDINEGNWLQLFFHFIVLMGKISWDIGISFFLLCFRFLKFSRIALLRKLSHLDSKTDLITNGLILKFFIAIWLFSLTSYLYGLKFALITRTCFPFWRHQIFSIVSLMGYSGLFFKNACTFWPLDFVISIDKL